MPLRRSFPFHRSLGVKLNHENLQKPGKKPASSLPEKIEDCEPDFLQLMNMSSYNGRGEPRYENGTGELFDVINGKIGDGLSAKEAM